MSTLKATQFDSKWFKHQGWQGDHILLSHWAGFEDLLAGILYQMGKDAYISRYEVLAWEFIFKKKKNLSLQQKRETGADFPHWFKNEFWKILVIHVHLSINSRELYCPHPN